MANRPYSETLLAKTTSLCISDILSDTSEDDDALPSQFTSLDIAMSMIDTDKLEKKWIVPCVYKILCFSLICTSINYFCYYIVELNIL